MLHDIIIYCALNNNIERTPDNDSDLVERMFEAITSNPDTNCDELPLVVDYDEVGVDSLYLPAREIVSKVLHVFFQDWIEGILNWQEGDCACFRLAVGVDICKRPFSRMATVIPGWGACMEEDSGSTCCHE